MANQGSQETETATNKEAPLKGIVMLGRIKF